MAVGSAAALKPPIDDLSDHAVAGLSSGGDVCGGRRPCSGDDVVSRRLGRLRGHPEPEGRLEGDDCVGGNQVRVGQEGRPDRFPGWSVVVVTETQRQRRELRDSPRKTPEKTTNKEETQGPRHYWVS